MRRIWIAALSIVPLLLSNGGTTVAQQQPSAPKRTATITDASKVFLSSVMVSKWGPGAQDTVVVPQPGKLTSTIYYDQPVALNIPFDVPFQGRPVWICYAIADREANAGLMPEFSISGLYRSDGKLLAGDAVMNTLSWNADSPLAQPGWVHRAAPIPTWMSRAPSPDVQLMRTGIETLAPEQFEQAPRATFFGPKILLKQAEPGAYVLWFHVRHWGNRAGWQTELEEPKRTISLRVSLLIAAAERPAEGPNYVDYLFHRGEKPPALDDQLFRAYRLDVNVTLARNGWVFSRSEIQPVRREVGEKSIKQGPLTAAITATANAGPRSVFLAMSTTTKDEKGAVAYEDAGEWRVNFPASIDDIGVADVVFTGSERHRAAPGYDASSSYKVVPWEQWLRGTMNEPHRYSDGVYAIHESGCPPLHGYGQGDLVSATLAKKWEMNDCRRTMAAPPDGQPYISRYFTRAPKPPDDPLTQTIGEQPIIVEQVGFWIVKGYYRRRSEAEVVQSTAASRATTGPAVKNEDKYWDWFADFSAKLEQAHNVIEIERATAALLGINVQNLRYSNRILLVPDMKVPDGDWFADRYQSMFGTDPVRPGRSDTDNRRQILARSQADELRETIEMIDASAKQATTAVAEMLTELNRACDAYKDTHPEVLMVRHAFIELSHRLPLEFAVATGELDALKKATETLRDAATSPEIRLWQARLQAQRGDMFEAWFALHEAVWYDPNHKEARLELSKLDAAFIGSSLRKAHGAIEEAREAFYRYMKDRGYSRDDPKNGWLGQLWAPLRDIDSEMAWSAFTSGASNLLVRFYIDRPAEEQRALSEYEASMARAYLGLQTILRLTMRGYTVEEISDMNTAVLHKALPLKHTNGDDYTPEQVTALGVTIQLAIRNLPDVRAMASADAIELKAAVDKGYWDPTDVGNTWAEWIGDLSSGKNLLLMLAPFSVGSVAGKVVTVERWGSGFWGMSAAEKSIMASEGIVRGTELIAPLIGWDRAMKVIGGSRQGERLLGLLDRMHKFETGLGTLPAGAPTLWARGQQALWYSGKFVATMAIQTFAGLSAEHVARGIAGERGGEVARFIVEAMMMLAQDHELTLKLLRSGVVEPKRMSRLIHEQYIPVMKQAQERIERRFALKAELQQILASRRQGNTLTPKESEALAKAYGLVPQGNAADLIPNGDPVHDSEIAFKSVIDEATGGDPLGPQYPAAAVEKMESRVRAKQRE